MAFLAPLRALRYNLAKVGSLAAVVTPPYDVINTRQQDGYYLRHEHNIIRIILGKDLPGDNETENRYARAVSCYKRWWIEEVLIRDRRPAIYFYEINYRLNGRPERLTRRGFISLVRLSEYAEGQVKPHERTFSATKQDRLSLMGVTQANFSQVFTLYDDPAGEVAAALEAGAAGETGLTFETDDGVSHRFVPVTDPATHLRVAELIRERPLYIADGHHRYETCLAYRNQMRLNYPSAPPTAPFNYTTVYATAMQDPGLTILPAHRLIKDLPGFREEAFLRLAERYFEIHEFPLAQGVEAAKAAFAAVLAAAGTGPNVVGFVRRGAKVLRTLTLKPGVMTAVALPPSLKGLDVMVLNEIVWGRCLGLSLQEMDNEKRFLYDADLSSAIDRVLAGEAELAFPLNPTRIEQLKAVSDAGLIMPRKSTYFYPKVITGLVINPLIASETVADPLAQG